MRPLRPVWQGLLWSVGRLPMRAGWTLNGGVVLFRWGSTAVRLNFHLIGPVSNLDSYYLTSPIVLVAVLSVFLIHSDQ